jgi:hypothetical protein
MSWQPIRERELSLQKFSLVDFLEKFKVLLSLAKVQCTQQMDKYFE